MSSAPNRGLVVMDVPPDPFAVLKEGVDTLGSTLQHLLPCDPATMLCCAGAKTVSYKWVVQTVFYFPQPLVGQNRFS